MRLGDSKAVVAAMLVAAFGGAACSEGPASPVAVDRDEAASLPTPAVSAVEADFRGFLWGDSIESVVAVEGKRSRVVKPGQDYATTLAGYPVNLRYHQEGGRLIGARYEFAWPQASTECRGTAWTSSVSGCWTQSRAYAAEVCTHIGRLLSEKYRSSADAVALVGEREVSVFIVTLDNDSDMSVAQQIWEGDRISVFQSLHRGRDEGQGWRCLVSYRATPEIEQSILARAAQDAKAAQRQADAAAIRDL